MSDDLTLRVWERNPPPRLDAHERRALARGHYRVDYEYIGMEETPVPVAPYCAGCREPWGADGCRTMRALGVLALAEHERDDARTKLKHATFALGRATTDGTVRLPRNNETLVTTVYVTAEALICGGVGVIDNTLVQIREQLVDWLRKANRDPDEEMAKVLNTALADWRRRQERLGGQGGPYVVPDV